MPRVARTSPKPGVETKSRNARDRDVHVVLAVAGDTGHHVFWRVDYRGHGAVTFQTQRDAIRYGRGLAMEKRCELVVHGRDGRIRRKDSFGNDPRGVKG
jgi:hypothetical protein